MIKFTLSVIVKKRELSLLFPVPCADLWKLIVSICLGESFYFYKGHGMRRGKSKNSKHTATVKWLLVINHKCMRTISFASCLLRKATKDSSAYSSEFFTCHFLTQGKTRFMRNVIFFPHQINTAGKEQVFPSVLKSRFLRLRLVQWLLHLLQTGPDKGAGQPPARWALHLGSILHSLCIGKPSSSRGREDCIQHP